MREWAHETGLAPHELVENVHWNVLRSGQRRGFDENYHHRVRHGVADELGPHAIAQRTQIEDFLGRGFEHGFRALEVAGRTADEERALTRRKLLYASQYCALHHHGMRGLRDLHERLYVFRANGAVLDDQQVRQCLTSDASEYVTGNLRVRKA